MRLKVLSKNGFYGWVNMAVLFFFNIAVMVLAFFCIIVAKPPVHPSLKPSAASM